MQSTLWIENEIKKWNIKEKGEIGCSLTVVWSQNLKDSFCKTGMLQTQLRYDCAAFPPQVSEKTEEWNTNLKEKIETGSEPKHRAAGETVKTRSKIQQGQWILAAKKSWLLHPKELRVKTYSSFPTLCWIYSLVGCDVSRMGRRLQELLAPAQETNPACGMAQLLPSSPLLLLRTCWRCSVAALEGKKLEFVTGGAQLQQSAGTWSRTESWQKIFISQKPPNRWCWANASQEELKSWNQTVPSPWSHTAAPLLLGREIKAAPRVLSCSFRILGSSDRAKPSRGFSLFQSAGEIWAVAAVICTCCQGS